MSCTDLLASMIAHIQNWVASIDLNASDYIAISSAIIAICALFVSIWQAHLSRQHNILSVKPLLDFRLNISENEPVKLTLENKGLGVAIIKSIEIEIHGEIFELGKSTFNLIANRYPVSIPGHHYSVIQQGSNIASGDIENIVEFGIINESNLYKNVKKIFSDSTFLVQYSCIYGKNYSAKSNFKESF